MSLQNLIGVSLETIEVDGAAIRRLLAAAERNIADSHVKAISNESRFDAAYKAIMQLANAALQANGFRTLTSRPGHHSTMIQVLNQTAGLDKPTVILLDALRKQRNLADYSGDPISASTAEDCTRQAESLFEVLRHWLSDNNPELLK